MNVFDASALLAYLRGEAGSEVVRPELERGGVCGAANWSEVAQKVRASGADWELARSLLLSFDLAIEPVLVPDAEDAAAMWQRGSGLSLADRLCLALAERLGATAWTADAQWGDHPRASQIR
ncbi:MAG: type II toxin-antitoxin system VapC family toxin [Terrimesophilobacter sp.]